MVQLDNLFEVDSIIDVNLDQVKDKGITKEN